MMDEHAHAAVVSTETGNLALVTVDRAGAVLAASPSFGELIGAAAGSPVVGRSLDELVAPRDRAALHELLAAAAEDELGTGGMRVLVTGRRDDGLPLVLDIEAPAAGVAANGDATGMAAGIALVVARAGGPVTWAGDASPPAPDRAGPDHVLSHDARAQVRNARNFLGLFSRKLAESDVDREALPAGFLETSLRALAAGDEILDRIVWYLRLENDPIAMQVLALDHVVDAARHTSQSDLDALSSIEGQDDLAAPISLELVAVGEDGEDGDALDPATAVVGNHELLVWLFAELLTNAQKFARQSTTVTITARRKGEWIEVAVRNTGHPIDGALAPDAFRLGRMLQARGDRPGVGLGLSLSRRIALRHGGRMVIEPTADGTAVTFDLLAAESGPVR